MKKATHLAYILHGPRVIFQQMFIFWSILFYNSLSVGCCLWEPERVTYRLSSPWSMSADTHHFQQCYVWYNHNPFFLFSRFLHACLRFSWCLQYPLVIIMMARGEIFQLINFASFSPVGLFIALATLGMIIHRYRFPDHPRPFKVHLNGALLNYYYEFVTVLIKHCVDCVQVPLAVPVILP